MNPLDPTDAFGDINRDGILNEAEIKMGLSPTAQVSSTELPTAISYEFNAQAADGGSSNGTCYDFSVEHLRLLTPAKTTAVEEGYNRIYYDVYQTAVDTPTTYASVRRACADVLFVDGKVKAPLTGTVSFVDSDFVDISSFNPSLNCKDLTKGVVFDAGIAGDAGVAVAEGGTG
jgi:hypothetical protein